MLHLVRGAWICGEPLFLQVERWVGVECRLGMNPRICRCCGEQIAERGNQLSRNPNVCASCSSMMDGMEDFPVEEALPNRDGMQRDSVPAKEAASYAHSFD